ncbi:MAG: hypothetical protein IE925_06260 [Rhodobacterales bacterium]|nr:hypothetical protein [Rhodobacterales bacterium]
MMFSPVQLSRSLGLAWAYAGQQAAALAVRLGLGPLGIRAVLPRSVCRVVDDELKRLETLVRRVLFLVAMDTPLPPVRQVARREPSGAEPGTKSPPAAPPPQLVFPFPAFRLTEATPSLSHKVSRVAARLAARARYRNGAEAGQAEPPVRSHPDDLLPAMRLMNRLTALEDALTDPERQVERLRRKLARIRADKTLKLPLADRPPRACVGPDIPPVLRELFWTLHDAALSWLPLLDSG